MEMVKKKIQSLQQQVDEAEDRALAVQKDLDTERELREKVRRLIVLLIRDTFLLKFPHIPFEHIYQMLCENILRQVCQSLAPGSAAPVAPAGIWHFACGFVIFSFQCVTVVGLSAHATPGRFSGDIP